MLTRNAAQLAYKELRRRRSRKGLSWWLLLLLLPLWLGLGALCGLSLWELPWRWIPAPLLWWFLGGLGAGMAVFFWMPLRPLYVFGHELTHWLAAKLLFRRTGAFRFGMTRGSMEIPEPNAFIALAPYFIPFYFLLSVGLLAFLSLVAGDLPRVFWMGGAAWVGLCFAYHIVLTVIAIKHGQSDFQYCGRLLSWIAIVVMNMLVVYATATLATGNPRLTWQIPWNICRGLLARLL